MTLLQLGTHPQRLDVSVRCGEEVDFAVTVRDSDGELVDLDGWTAASKVRDTHSLSGSILHTFTTEVLTNSVRVTVSGALTRYWPREWPDRVVPWDLVVFNPDGESSIVAQGWISLYSTVSY